MKRSARKSPRKRPKRRRPRNKRHDEFTRYPKISLVDMLRRPYGRKYACSRADPDAVGKNEGGGRQAQQSAGDDRPVVAGITRCGSGEAKTNSRRRRQAGRQSGSGRSRPAAKSCRNSGGRLGFERKRSRSEEHTSELQSPCNLVCRLLLEKKK